MCVCLCPSWRMSSVQRGRGSVASLFSCARARRVKSCRGSLTHIGPWALSHIHTMRLRCLGLDLGPQAFGSHTLNQYSSPGLDSELVTVTVLGVAGRSAAPSSSSFHSTSTSSFLKYEDPWRYLILPTTLYNLEKSATVV